MSLLIQDFLLTKTFGELQSLHGVEISFHSTGHKWSLNYSQLNSKEDDLLACQCRGLILACDDGRSLNDQAKMVNGRLNFDDVCPGKTIVLAYPMRRFFNEGQGFAAEIDWMDPYLSIDIKVDGTLAIIYFDTVSRQWCMGTRSVSEADLPGQDGRTFRQLFETTLRSHLNQSWEDFTAALDVNRTYCFELCTPYNEVVVKHKESRIYFLTARDARTHQELNVNDPSFDHLPKPAKVNLNKLDEIISFVHSANVQEQEGVVVKQGFKDEDGHYPRIKVKHPKHGLYSRAREMIGGSERNQLDLILSEKEDDIFPFLALEIVEKVQSLKESYAAWLKMQEALYQSIAAEAASIDSSKKTFALTVQKHRVSYPPPFYAVFDNKAKSIKDFIALAQKEGTWSNAFLDRLLTEIKTTNTFC
jgi:RNA ligase-like protein